MDPADHPLIPHLPLIERIVRSLARRKCLTPDEAEDFASEVKVWLLEDSRRIFDKFQGKSSLSTYLTVVVHNLFRDFRTAKLGKWRPSSAAQRMGTVGVQLETLLSRDGLSFDEACQKLWTNLQVRASVEELARMAGRLPVRTRRFHEGEDILERLPAATDTERSARLREVEPRLREVEEHLRAALAGLPDEDRSVLQLHIGKGLSLAATARALQIDQKPLYRRLPRLLDELRQELERRGVSHEEIRSLLCDEDAELVFQTLAEEESPGMRSSK